MIVEPLTIYNLPAEVLGCNIMLPEATLKTLACYSLVSKEWNNLASSNELWNTLFPGVISVCGDLSTKTFVNAQKVVCAVSNAEELAQSIFKYSSGSLYFSFFRNDKNKVKLQCLFPLNPKASLLIEHSYLQPWSQREGKNFEFSFVYTKALSNDESDGRTLVDPTSQIFEDWTWECHDNDFIQEVLTIREKLKKEDEKRICDIIQKKSLRQFL